MSALRQEMLKKWLTGLNGFEFDLQTLQAASSDASFRRYFRVGEANNVRTLIVMDAPPDKEDVRPFVHVAGLLRDGGSRAPQVLAQNPEEGFLLLED
ncbi:phosphotransferase, partial [Limnobacter sp.]